VGKLQQVRVSFYVRTPFLIPLSRYIRKFEKYTPNPRFPEVDPLLRGTDGPVEIGYNAHTWQGSEAFIQASMNAGIPFTSDFCTTKGTKGTNKVRTFLLYLLTGWSFMIHLTLVVYTHRQVSSWRS